MITSQLFYKINFTKEIKMNNLPMSAKSTISLLSIMIVVFAGLSFFLINPTLSKLTEPKYAFKEVYPNASVKFENGQYIFQEGELSFNFAYGYHMSPRLLKNGKVVVKVPCEFDMQKGLIVFTVNNDDLSSAHLTSRKYRANKFPEAENDTIDNLNQICKQAIVSFKNFF